jgi:hypothetical protein
LNLFLERDRTDGGTRLLAGEQLKRVCRVPERSHLMSASRRRSANLVS